MALDHGSFPSATYYLCFHSHCWRRNSGPIPPYSPILLSQEREPVNESVGGISCPSFPQMSVQLFSTNRYYSLRIHCKVIVSPGNLRKSSIIWGNKTIMIFTLPQCITILVFKAFPKIFWFCFFNLKKKKDDLWDIWPWTTNWNQKAPYACRHLLKSKHLTKYPDN